jgi:hypothetical protein
MAFIYDLTDTWNAGGTTFNAIKMNVTDTASAAASRLVSLQVGGADRFSVDKAGIGAFGSVVRAATGTTTAPAFSFTGDTNTGMWSPAADTLAFSTNGSERARITSAGNVGIGTTSPRSKLDSFVSGNFDPSNSAATAAMFARNSGTSGSGNYGGSISFSKPLDGFRPMGAISSVQTTDDPEQGGLAFFVHPSIISDDILSESMRITNAGNVGIGTSSPAFPVDVSGILRATDIYVGTLSSGNPGFNNTDTGVHLDGGFTSFFSRNDGGNNGAARFNRNTSDGPLISFSREGSQIGFIGAASSGLTFAAGGTTERMRITSAGNVGIGTSSPNAAAHLDVTSTTSGFLPPRMTTTQRDAIGSPPNGLMLYNTTTNKLQVRAAGSWVDLH